MKEWVCSERPIAICTIENAWLYQGSRIWPECDVTRWQRLTGALVSFTLLAHQHAQHATYGPFPAASLFIFTGWFHIHLFFLLKAQGAARRCLLWRPDGNLQTRTFQQVIDVILLLRIAISKNCEIVFILPVLWGIFLKKMTGKFKL